jgi:hypothetical protein
MEISVAVTPQIILATAVPIAVNVAVVPLQNALIDFEVNEYHEILSATEGQTVFSLASAPLSPDKSKVFVEPSGIKLFYLSDYAISGQVLTLADGFLSVGESLDVYYY